MATIKQKFLKLNQLAQNLLLIKDKNKFFEKIYKKKLKKTENLDRKKDNQVADKLVS